MGECCFLVLLLFQKNPIHHLLLLSLLGFVVGFENLFLCCFGWIGKTEIEIGERKRENGGGGGRSRAGTA